MAAVDLAGFMTDLKEHAAEHGFHLHDERHYVETYSMRQTFEVDLHPVDSCGGPLDLHLALEAEPRVLLAFEDAIMALPDGDLPEEDFFIGLSFNWALPPLEDPPELIVLATELGAVGGLDLPIEVDLDQAARRDLLEQQAAPLVVEIFRRQSLRRAEQAVPDLGCHQLEALVIVQGLQLDEARA